ncbi:GntR family transcriptional regulator [Yoonia vestfoldensis]|uniref:GntR family transcriptional regulator n=1 Tax=Yoonia vestfoldensis TaxID=245188 RepID=UPI000376177D|nr:GntR family transcriptional regulator [Yoonia vestfoldensis]
MKRRDVLSQTIALKLEAAIIAGELAAGTRLDEVTLADRYDVSRTPVREALQILVSRALVTRIPFRGTVVTEITHQRINELFEAMGEIEALCGRFAAERMGMDERAKLESLHDDMAQIMLAQDVGAYEQANTVFHQLIYLGARNSEFQALAEAMRLKLAPFRRRQLADEHRIARSHREHAQIVEAVMQRNGAAADKALRRHLTSAAKAMLLHWPEDTPFSQRRTSAS